MYTAFRNNSINFHDPMGAAVDNMAPAVVACVQGFLQGAAGSISMGTLPEAQPSPEDTVEQRICQAGGAMWVAYESGKLVISGTGLVAGGAVSELPTLGASTAAVAGGVVAIGAGTAGVTGSLVYLSEAAETPVSGGDESQEVPSEKPRTEPRDLAEELTLDEATAGAGKRIMQGEIDDPMYPEDIWAKMQHVHENPDGTKIVIHYWENLQTGAREGFKFK
jgi:hypothetical protein